MAAWLMRRHHELLAGLQQVIDVELGPVLWLPLEAPRRLETIEGGVVQLLGRRGLCVRVDLLDVVDLTQRLNRKFRRYGFATVPPPATPDDGVLCLDTDNGDRLQLHLRIAETVGLWLDRPLA